MLSRLRFIARRSLPHVLGTLVLIACACGAPSAPNTASRSSLAATGASAPTPTLRPQVARQGEYLAFEATTDGFPLVASKSAATVWVSLGDLPSVRRAARDLVADIERVTGVRPELIESASPPTDRKHIVLIGTLGKTPSIDQLATSQRLAVDDVAGRWETSLQQVVTAPWPGTQRALVLTGSDQRGTVYALYDVSKHIGVSPWYYWDDIPVAHRDELWVRDGAFSQGTPAVRYRGFFINDEAPALATWAMNTFGPAPNPSRPHGFNHHFYAKVYEVLLRLKANYLWPAVWSRSLFDDDPENQRLAAEFGVVMGTSHEAPMMRAQDEWDRYGQANGPYGGNGAFSFVRNQATLEHYWADSIRRANGFESLVTVGMRGNGDVGMEDAQGIELMGRIVQTQRHILEQVTGKPANQVPQVWTMYKEVQRYWEEGMRAPDDVTIIWCDDNWGNLRGLPDAQAAQRSGGHGIYYHFDYVGGGRNYKWVDTVNLANTWEQLHLAYARGARQVWMVNVGDLKNVEQPLQFFLDYAWAPAQLPLEKLPEWELAWARAHFGAVHASEIAAVFSRYHRLQSRRKPELLNRRITLDPTLDLAADPNRAVVYSDDSPFSLTNYQEIDRVTDEWRELAQRSTNVAQALPAAYQDAYFQLVDYAVAATANLYALRRAEFLNLYYASQGRVSANALTQEVATYLARDNDLSHHYNETIAGGKWRGFQTQAKLGYGGPYANSNWQQPELDGKAAPDFVWPAPKLVKPLAAPSLGVAVSEAQAYYPKTATLHTTQISPFQTGPLPTVEVFNRGKGKFHVDIKSSVPWLTVEPSSAEITEQQRFSLRVDFSRVPVGNPSAVLQISATTGQHTNVIVPVFKPDLTARTLRGVVEAQGFVSVEAEHFDRKFDSETAAWQVLPGLGRTGAGVTTFPPTSPRQPVDESNPHLEYDLELFTSGTVEVSALLSPRLPTHASDGLLYGISVDDAPIQVVNTTTSLSSKPDSRGWERNTSDNINHTKTSHQIATPGRHVLKFWMIDPTVIAQKFIVDTGGLRPTYLGPPESLRVPSNPRSD